MTTPCSPDTGLLPCPFCGDDAHIGSGDGRYYVACDALDCFCAVGEAYDRDAMPDHVYYDEDTARAAWNRRCAAQTPGIDPVTVEALALSFVSIIQDGIAQEAGSKSIASMIINELLVRRALLASPAPGPLFSGAANQMPTPSTRFNTSAPPAPSKSEAVAWLVTWTTKHTPKNASAYVTEDEARRAGRNVESYADASNVVVTPAYASPASTNAEAVGVPRNNIHDAVAKIFDPDTSTDGASK